MTLYKSHHVAEAEAEAEPEAVDVTPLGAQRYAVTYRGACTETDAVRNW